jgi:glycosyltransferase involved in cell wall biosynthesis
MKTSFFHDTRFYYDLGGVYYTSNGLTSDLFDDYTLTFGDLTVVARQEHIPDNIDQNKLSKSSQKGVKFNCVAKLGLSSLVFGRDGKMIRDEVRQSDFVIARLPSIIGIFACIQARIQHKPYLVEMVACPWDSIWNHGKIKYKIAAPILFIINRLIIRQATNVLYVSNQFLQERYPNKHHNIGCSDVVIEATNYNVLEQRQLKIKNNHENTTYKIGLIGSYDVNFKGHETAIQAVSLLKNELNFELHFLGSGHEENKKRWMALAEKYNVGHEIFFDGTLPSGESVFRWMDDVDIYLIPSLQEGLPRALIEAMSRASVCVGVKTGGIPELLDLSVVVDKKDYKALAKVISKLIKDTNFALDQAQRNFYTAKEYGKKRLAKKRTSFYTELKLRGGMK